MPAGFSNCEIARSPAARVLQEISGKFRWGLSDWPVTAARCRKAGRCRCSGQLLIDRKQRPPSGHRLQLFGGDRLNMTASTVRVLANFNCVCCERTIPASPRRLYSLYSAFRTFIHRPKGRIDSVAAAFSRHRETTSHDNNLLRRQW